MELRAWVAFCTTSAQSLVGSAKAFSIAVTAAFTLVIAESVFGKPAAFARYSPISAESLVNFLRFSSFFFTEASTDDKVAAVAPTKLVVSEFVLTVFDSIVAGFKIDESILSTFDSFWVDTFFSSWISDTVFSEEAPTDVDTLLVWLVDWLKLVDVLAESEALALAEDDVLAEALTDVLAEALAEVLAEVLADELLDTDSEIEALSLIEVDKLAEFSELLRDVVPKTAVSFVTKRSGFSSVFSTATVSFANTFVWVATVPPKTAPVAASPLIISRPVIEGFTLSSATSVMTWVVSTPPRKTLNKPKREVEARNQCFPDLINLYRVTRSVSLYSPFWRLKNMFYPFPTYQKWTIHPILIIPLKYTLNANACQEIWYIFI